MISHAMELFLEHEDVHGMGGNKVVVPSFDRFPYSTTATAAKLDVNVILRYDVELSCLAQFVGWFRGHCLTWLCSLHNLSKLLYMKTLHFWTLL